MTAAYLKHLDQNSTTNSFGMKQITTTIIEKSIHSNKPTLNTAAFSTKPFYVDQLVKVRLLSPNLYSVL